MNEHSFLSIPGVTWWLHCGQRMIRSGLLVIVPFALGRPLESMVERVKGSAERETVMEVYEA